MTGLKNQYWVCMREEMGEDKQRFIPLAKVLGVKKGQQGTYLMVDKDKIFI